ncbi:MAG: heparinase II/III-family protein, partial [Bacteroidales bacterium]|nr:heparinase II/III-family protein [Bacteroidales bacterium]
VMLSRDGLAVAEMIQAGLAEPFVRRSLFLSDGINGTKGGMAIMRSGDGENQSSVIFKFTTQGMGHGHFDRLSFIFYDRGNEIFADYGAARFVNVESKDGGRYLPENKSWAVQTIAHNTVAVNGQSQFGASVKAAEEYHPTLLFYDLHNSGFQIVAAADSNSYDGIVLQRTIGLLNAYNRLFIIDLYRITNAGTAVYDLPFYYNGQITAVNFKYDKELVSKKAFGVKNGYQHLWVDGVAESVDTTASVTIMNDRRFYSLSVLGNRLTDVYFTSLGAGDPHDNLRYQPGIIFRQNNTRNHAFLSVTEAHGSYLPFDESVQNSSGSVKTLELQSSGDDCSLIVITLASGEKIKLGVSHINDPDKEHSASYRGEELRWKGNYQLITE